MTTRYICCRCDAQSADALGAHVCEAPSDESLWAAVRDLAYKSDVIARGECINGLEYAIAALGRDALYRCYRFTLTQLGADEYRVSFFCNIDTLAATALDRTPARAFARAWRRLPIESEGGT